MLVTGTTNGFSVSVHIKESVGNGILSLQNVVAFSSAWAGLKEEATVDEVEAVRIVSGEPPGYVTTLKRWRTNPDGNGWNKTLSVM